MFEELILKWLSWSQSCTTEDLSLTEQFLAVCHPLQSLRSLSYLPVIVRKEEF